MENKKKILIIEDEETTLKILFSKFEEEGFVVLESKNGLDGLEIAKKEKPDLILLDLIMPKMDGITMLKKLREDQWGAKVKVIILTNLSDDQKISQSLEAGVFDYLIKTDWKIDDLIKKVKEKLGVK